MDTIVNVDAVQRSGVKAEGNAEGNAAAASASVLAELAQLVADGQLEVPVEATFPLDQVREEYRRLGQRHTHGKIVLVP